MFNAIYGYIVLIFLAAGFLFISKGVFDKERKFWITGASLIIIAACLALFL